MIECASTPQLLHSLEICPRKAFYSRSWRPQRLQSREMVSRALRKALIETETQEMALGEVAGAEVMQLAEDRGLDTQLTDIYSQVCHNACLSDILVSAIRKQGEEAWKVPEPVQDWTTECLMSPDGNYLRRITLVSHWNEQRHYGEIRSWYTLGEICHYVLPMQLIVLVIGQERNGKRHTPWTMGYQHPMNHTLRFRKKSRSTSEVFNDRWTKVYREDHAEITRETWLNAMLKDDVLPEVCFKVDIPVPEKLQCQRIRDMARRKLDRLHALGGRPEANLSSCDWPTPCVFRRLCWTSPDRHPSEKNGFIPVAEKAQEFSEHQAMQGDKS